MITNMSMTYSVEKDGWAMKKSVENVEKQFIVTENGTDNNKDNLYL